MNASPVVSRDEWLIARKALLTEEKALTRAQDAVHARRRELPMVAIDKEYVFDGPSGKVRLPDLFEGRRQLIVYHFMWRPEPDEGCPTCSFLVDSIGHQSHLHAADTTLALVSRAPLASIQRFKQRMGWTLPWYSSYGTDFNYDFHVTNDEAVAPIEYNYKDRSTLESEGMSYALSGDSHGVSVFLRDGDRVLHSYSTYGRGAEPLLGTYHFLDLTPLGRQKYVTEFLYHDRYES
jgi:predicted dithiol-disulfide oxidoreductase (DUF899 family)